MRYQVSIFLKKNSFLLTVFYLLTIPSCTKDADFDKKVELLPNSGSVLWGYREISINYDFRRDLNVKKITINSGQGEESLIKDDNPIRKDAGCFKIILCAECIKSGNVSVRVEFEKDQEPVTQTYKIDHMPTVLVRSEAEGSTLFLDAGESKDPEGKELKFEWTYEGKVYEGSRITVTKDSIIKKPALLKVSDGITAVYDIVTYDPYSQQPIYTPENLKCVDMQVVTIGKSSLNSEVDLGKFPKDDIQLPVDGDKKLTSSYFIGITFEVKCEIQQHGSPLDEGQDAAGTHTVAAHNFNHHKKAKQRDPDNRSKYIDDEKNAPFPVPIPPGGQHPQMVEDDYDHHPTIGFTNINTATGTQRIEVKKKGLISSGEKNYIVWIDQPGLELPAGTDLSGGAAFKGYFRSWMIPNNPPCEKYFMIEIEIDAKGKITKNTLTMR